jgi:alpha-galactosidase
MPQRTCALAQCTYSCALPFAALAAFFCLFAFSTGADAQQWVLDNGKVSLVLAFDPQSGLFTKSWRDLETQTDLIKENEARASNCKEFEVQVDGQAITGSAHDMTLEAAPTAAKRGQDESLDVTLVARNLPLRVVIHYQAPTGFAAVRLWLTLENTGPKTLTLRNLTVACQPLSPGPVRDRIAYGHYGEEPRETFFTGRVNDVAPMVENARTGLGLAVLSEVPGYLRRTEVGFNYWNQIVYAMYDTDLFPFERSLSPGEKFETAAASVVFYRRGTARDPHWILPQYVEQVIAHNKNERQPEWIYNDWEPWNGTANDATLNAVLPRAAGMGLTLNTIDEGWEKTLGDNTVNPERFPNGLDAVYDSGNGAAQKRGLWLPVALVSRDASVFREHPDWVCRGRDGKPKSSQGQGVVMCMASPYKQAVLERVTSAVERYKLDYVKLDLTTVFNAYSEEPGCYETGHEHASSAESSVRIYESLDWLADKLHERFPNLLIDYTFELWGEKHLIDYGLLRVADLDWMSNVTDHHTDDAGPLQVRTLLYQRGMAIPTEDMLIGNLQGEMPSWQERIATEMGSAPVFLGDLRKLSEQDAKQASEWISRFRTLRSEVRLQESFFPLGSWRQPRIDEWDGYARFAKTGEGLVVIFRNDSVDSSAKIAIPGFPDGAFNVTNWQSGARVAIEGKTIRSGWEIPGVDQPRVSILEVRKQ